VLDNGGVEGPAAFVAEPTEGDGVRSWRGSIECSGEPAAESCGELGIFIERSCFLENKPKSIVGIMNDAERVSDKGTKREGDKGI
jgi:hypothetical protein